MFLFLLNRCCAAAWEQKMKDTVGQTLEGITHPGAAAAAAVRIYFS